MNRTLHQVRTNLTKMTTSGAPAGRPSLLRDSQSCSSATGRARVAQPAARRARRARVVARARRMGPRQGCRLADEARPPGAAPFRPDFDQRPGRAEVAVAAEVAAAVRRHARPRGPAALTARFGAEAAVSAVRSVASAVASVRSVAPSAAVQPWAPRG